MAYTSIASVNDRYGNRIFHLYESFAPGGMRQKRNHRHAEFEVSFILAGSGLYSTPLGEVSIREGDVFLFSSNEYHNIIKVDGAEDGIGMHILNVHFLAGFLCDGASVADSLFMNVFLNRTPHFCNRLNRDEEALGEIRRWLLSLRDECVRRDPCYITQVKNLLTTVLITILRRFGYADLSRSTLPEPDFMDDLQKALSYINANYTGEISLDGIAAAVNQSRFRFAKAFRAAYNMTTWDYINIRRIDRARELLAGTDDTVLAVATRCGYNNTANFNRIFKKITGITPHEYRAVHRQTDRPTTGTTATDASMVPTAQEGGRSQHPYG